MPPNIFDWRLCEMLPAFRLLRNAIVLNEIGVSYEQDGCPDRKET